MLSVTSLDISKCRIGCISSPNSHRTATEGDVFKGFIFFLFFFLGGGIFKNF